MAGYWLVRASESTDAEAASEYAKLWKPIAEKYQAKILVSKGEHKTVEGKDLPRNLLIEFPSYQQALACYNDPDYGEAAELALRAYDRELVILEGN
ncbi:MAG: DUF1330 domain-containing protein [Gammaproteobacteria bacterium]|nr:DUF1330 domain-containing protein [Gammaproteobacteria bacterium]